MRPLIMKNLMCRTMTYFRRKEIVSREPPRMFRYTYSDLDLRMRRLANELEGLGVKRGDPEKPGTVVGHVGWADHRFLELYLAAPAMGAIYHGINPLFPKENILHIVNNGGCELLFLNEEFIPTVEEIENELKTVRSYVLMTDKEKLPETKLSPIYSFEELLSQAPSDYTSPDIDEGTGAYMSQSGGVTGLPKLILHSQREIYLMSLFNSLPDSGGGLSERDVIMMSMPPFYADAWYKPHVALLLGSKMVLPGPHPDGRVFLELIQQEKVTHMFGPSPYYVDMMNILETEGLDRYDLSSMRVMETGGAPVAPYLVEFWRKKVGLNFRPGWGATEIGTPNWVIVSGLKSYLEDLPEEGKDLIYTKTGIPGYGVEVRLLNEKGEEIKHDGKEVGEMWIRNLTRMPEYYKDPRNAQLIKEGWCNTTDAFTMDEEGYMQQVDRAVDMIKVAGETVLTSTFEFELMKHPAVREVAVIGVPDERLGEKPLAVVVLKEPYVGKVTEEELAKLFEGKCPENQIPKVTFTDKIPRTTLGKWDKGALKEKYRGK